MDIEALLSEKRPDFAKIGPKSGHQFPGIAAWHRLAMPQVACM